MPERVERHDPDGVDYGWVMQTTFVTTILVGAPVVALLSLVAPPQDTWAARAEFALRVGAVVWLVTSVAVYLYAARVAESDDSTLDDSAADNPGTDDSDDGQNDTANADDDTDGRAGGTVERSLRRSPRRRNPAPRPSPSPGCRPARCRRR